VKLYKIISIVVTNILNSLYFCISSYDMTKSGIRTIKSTEKLKKKSN